MKLTINELLEKKEILKAQSPWVEVADKIQKCIDSKDWCCDNGFVCEGDRSIVDKHNEKCKDLFKYMTKTLPYAYSGNILDAKIIILSLNPGYREEIDVTAFNKLSDEKKKAFYQSRIDDFSFNSNSMIEPEMMEIESNTYWQQRLSSLWEKENNDKDTVLKNIAILQSVGYHSKSFTEYRSLGRLSSSRYVYKIIDYLAAKSNCIFIILRRNYFWEYLLDIKDVSSDRIIKLNSSRATAISRGNMSEEDFKKVSERLER